MNRLNQLGVYNPEGNLVQKRHHDHPAHGNHIPARTIKVTTTNHERYFQKKVRYLQIIVPPADNRFTEPAGRYRTPHIADTTYLIPETAKYKPFPIAFNNHLPLIPQGSLMLVRYYQQKKFGASRWQKPTTSDGLLPEQVICNQKCVPFSNLFISRFSLN